MTLRHLLVLLLFTLLPGLAPAAWPERPIRLIVPFPPGGPNDVIARLVAEPLARQLGQPVVIENRAGAGGTIGAEAGAKAPADGHTLTLGSTSSHSLAGLIGPRPAYSPLQSFAPIGLVGTTPTVLLASNRLEATSLAAMLAHARQHPGRLNYGSSGNGTLNHLVTEYFKQRTRTFLVHIPYRGTGQAMADLHSGQIDPMFDAVITAVPQIKAGRVRALAVTGARRLPELPALPTFEESGLPGFEASLWVGLLAPAGTPTEIVARLNRELQATLRREDVQSRMRALGFEPMPGDPQDLANHMQTVERTWSQVVRDRRLQTD